jgi:hypothetical protein
MERGDRRRAIFRLLFEAGILVSAYMAYEAVRRLVAPSSHEAINRGISLIRLEQQLGIFYEPNLQALIVDHQWLVTLFNWIYVWGYLPVIGLAALYLYVLHRDVYDRYRNAFLLSGAIGLVMFATLPVAPPRMFPEFGFIDTVHVNSGLYRSIQQSDLVNEFAALPSFHFGWILLVGMALFQTTHRLMVRVVGMVLPLLMLLAIIFTANHYVLDAVAGGAIVLLAFGVVLLFEAQSKRWATRRPLASGALR